MADKEQSKIKPADLDIIEHNRPPKPIPPPEPPKKSGPDDGDKLG